MMNIVILFPGQFRILPKGFEDAQKPKFDLCWNEFVARCERPRKKVAGQAKGLHVDIRFTHLYSVSKDTLWFKRNWAN